MEAKEKIIVIDDNAVTRDTLSLFLNKVGYKTEIAQTGQEAINKITKEFYNVALLDIKLPDIEGIELLKPLKDKHPNMDVIIMTGNASLNSAVQALNEGASGYILKPFNMDNLLTNIKNFIEKQHLIAEKQQTEQKLKESEKKYRNLVENIPNAIYSALPDETGTTTFMSNRWKDWTGYSPEDFYKDHETWPKSIHQEDRDGTIKKFVDAFNEKTEYTLEYRVVHKDTGEIRYVRDRGVPIFNEKGNIKRFDGVVCDITESKEAEQKLKKSEEKWRSITKYTPDHILMMDKDAKILFINYTVPDLSIDEVIGMSIFDFVQKEYQELQRNVYDKILNNGEPRQFETGYLDKNGKQFYFEIHSGPVWKDGKVIGIINRSTDITERKITAQKLKESEEKFRNMVNNLDVGFFTVSLDGIYLEHNPELNRMLGINPLENLTGSKTIDFWQNPKDRQNYLKELTKNGFIKDFVVYAKKISGEQIILQANAHLIRNSNGEMIAIEGTFTDITERYYMEEKLRMNEELFRDFFDSAAIGFHIFKSDRIITDMNKYELDLLGYSREEIVDKKTWYDLIIPEQKLQFEKHWNDILDNGSVNNLEYTLIHKDGHFIDVLLNASSRFDDKDNLINTRGSVLNITDRKEVEEALKNSEYNLKERVKELTCLYELSKLVGSLDYSLEEILQGTLDLIPPAWQYSEITCARISFNGQEFKTKNFMETEWKLKAGIKRRDEIIGTIEVYYLKNMPIFDEGPFLKEERNLINALAEVLGSYFERKMAEQKLKESEEKWRALSENSPAHVLLLDREHKILFINRAVPDLSKEEVIGASIFNYTPQEFHKVTRDLYYSVWETGEPSSITTKYITKEGDISYFDMWVGPVFQSEKVVALITHSMDITERKKIEQELKESEEKYRHLVENIPDAIYSALSDETGTATFVSNRWKDWTGYSPEDFYKDHETWPKSIHQEDRDGILKKYTDAFREKTEYTLEYRLVHKDTGEIRYVRDRGVPIFDEKGNIRRFDGVVSDITESKEAEQKLRESEEKYRELYENAPSAYFSVHPDKSIKGCNQPACDLLGYTKKEILDLNVFDLYSNSPEGLQKAKKLFKQFVEGKIIEDVEIQMKHKNGNPFWVSLTVKPVKNEKGKVVESRSMVININERKEAEAKIKSLAKFPSENPNPVLRVSKEKVIYTNTAGQLLFEIEEGDNLPILFKEIVFEIIDTNTIKTSEIKLIDQIYSFAFTPIKEGNYVNVYGLDITERRIAEQLIQQRTKEISSLFDASRAVLQYSDFEKTQKMIFDSCNDLIGAEVGYLALSALVKGKYQKIFINPESLLSKVNSDLSMPVRGMQAEIVKSKKTIYYNDFMTSKWKDFLPKGHIHIRNVLIAPLVIGDDVKGFMGLANKEGGFNKEDARLATTFAEIASISLFNTQTLESLENSEQKYKRLSNILEQKVEERTIELKESEEKIQNLITNISDVLFEADPNGLITYISPQIKNIIGYQSGELLELNLADFVHNEDIHYFKEMSKKAIKTQKAVSLDYRIKHKKGYFVPICARWSIVEINNQPKVFGLLSDNTERKKIDDMIKREIKQLKKLDQIRNDLISRISHELNTPLISILNGSQFLLDFHNKQMSNDVEDVVKIIHQGGYRLKEMVDNLITAYELETEQIVFNIKRENLSLIIKECVENLMFQAEKRKIFINIELLDELYIDVDKEMIKKAISNLLSNAVKNTTPNGNIYIKSIEHQNFMDIIIRDTGVGITEKELPTLFKKFGKIERYGKGLDVDIEGPGLGLYLANEIVKLHIGEILVKSKGRNKGSTFILRLFMK